MTMKMTLVQGVTMYKDRPIIPPSLRLEVLYTLHSGHQGSASMLARASNSVRHDQQHQDEEGELPTVNSNTPSQTKEPPAPLPDLQYSFQQICLDYFTLKARQYLVIVDRYSGWPSVQQAKKGNASKLINFLRTYCETFGAPEVLTSDGGPQCIVAELLTFLETWDIDHMLNSAYKPHGNKRAELKVKSMKRMIQALLVYRNQARSGS